MTEKQPYAGFYINLDRDADRRAEIEAELERKNLRHLYARFRAADGNVLGLPKTRLQNAEVGCFTSHYMVLKENLERGVPVHVVEDDVIFAPCTEATIRWTIDSGKLDDYDILYLDVTVPVLNDAYRTYKAMYDRAVTRNADGGLEKIVFQSYNLRHSMFASASSYLVGPKSIRLVQELYFEEMNRAAPLPIDLFIRKACGEGRLRVGCIFPFVTSVRPDRILQTNIEHPNELSALASHIGRYSFYIGCDWNECRDYLNRFFPVPPASDTHAQILNHLLAFSITDKYHTF